MPNIHKVLTKWWNFAKPGHTVGETYQIMFEKIQATESEEGREEVEIYHPDQANIFKCLRDRVQSIQKLGSQWIAGTMFRDFKYPVM